MGLGLMNNGIPTYSLPFQIHEAPADAISFAIILEDKDAHPVTGGFVWIYWIVANITRTEVLENVSQASNDFIQGMNSWTSIQGGKQAPELSCFYGGMTLPEQPYIYGLHVYALNTLLNLKKGFLLNNLYRKMDGHILEADTMKGIYKN